VEGCLRPPGSYSRSLGTCRCNKMWAKLRLMSAQKKKIEQKGIGWTFGTLAQDATPTPQSRPLSCDRANYVICGIRYGIRLMYFIFYFICFFFIFLLKEKRKVAHKRLKSTGKIRDQNHGAKKGVWEYAVVQVLGSSFHSASTRFRTNRDRLLAVSV